MREKPRATYASKVSGKKRRWSRDLRGRFSRSSETSRSPGDTSRSGETRSRKIYRIRLASGKVRIQYGKRVKKK